MENSQEIKGQALETLTSTLIANGGSIDLTIREGKAIELKEPKIIALAGVLDSPFKWLEKRVALHEQTAAHILVDRDKMTISLVLNETDHYRTSVSGKLEIHPIFKRFGINEGNYTTPFELAELIKMNRTFFENQDTAMTLVSTLKNFKAKIDKQVQAANDNRGNVTAMIQQAVDSNLPASFYLVLPIFKGQDKVKLEVEVYIRANDLTCTLVSAQANDEIEHLRDTAIDKVLGQIREIAPDIAIIEQ